jgi:hypothetical protein
VLVFYSAAILLGQAIEFVQHAVSTSEEPVAAFQGWVLFSSKTPICLSDLFFVLVAAMLLIAFLRPSRIGWWYVLVMTVFNISFLFPSYLIAPLNGTRPLLSDCSLSTQVVVACAGCLLTALYAYWLLRHYKQCFVNARLVKEAGAE